MKRNSIHFNTEEEGGGTATAEAGAFNADIFKEALAEIPATPADGAVTEEKPADAAAVVEGSEAEKPADATGEKPADEAADASAVDAEATDDVVVADLTASEEGADTWIEVATRFGVEPPTDPEDFETVEKNVQAKFVSEREAGRAEGRAEVQAVDLDKYEPEAVSVINALMGGKKVADILYPLQGFNNALAMSPEARLTAYYTDVLKLTPDAAADQIAVLEQSGGLAAKDAEIRASLEAARDTTFNNIINEGANVYKSRMAAEKAKTEAENKTIKEAIRSRKEFMGFPVTEAQQATLEKNWDAGAYKKMMATDPQSVAEFILWKTFGEQRTKQLVEKTEKTTKLGVIKKQANTPVQPAGTKVQQSKEVVDTGAGNFDAAALREGINEMRGSDYDRK